MNIKHCFLYLILVLIGVSCGDNFFYDKTQTINEVGWAYEDTLNYEVEIKDTTKLYNLTLLLSHTKDYPTQNIYTRIHTQFPSGQRFTKQVSIDLAEVSGKWYGDCSGNHCTLSVDIQKGAYFNEIGKYVFTVEQFTRMNPLPHIKKVRLILEDTKQHRK